MSVDVMARLAHANPVPEPPAVDAPVGLRRRIEDDDRSNGAAGSPRRARARRRALAGVASIAGVSVVVAALLLAGSSGSGSNVLAAVYAATAPNPGIVEAVTLTRSFGGPGHNSVARQREWTEASGTRRRALTSFTGSRFGSGVAQIDVVYKPREWEAWGNDRGFRLLPQSADAKPNIVHRIRWSGAVGPNDQHLGFLGGGILVGAEWAQLYRALYSKGQMRVVGRERHAGRLLWKLEASPARAEARAREDHTQFVVLVDPHTFLPVYTRLTNLALPGHPPVSESELLSYRTLPSAAVNEKLFDLALQHPHAQVVSQAGVIPSSGPPRRH